MNCFDTMFNSNEKQSFARDITSGHLSHAYIVDGGEGFGKTSFAFYAAAAILCTGKNPPCGNCPSCKKIFNDSHPDLFYFSTEKAKSIGVEAIRDIKKSIYIVPSEGEKKVYIIDNAEKMTVQAQNALLKFFEEPPESTVFFLVTEKKESLLPTVISRGRVITLFPAPNKMIFDCLKKLNPKKFDADLMIAVSLCGGSIGEAIRMAGKDSNAQKEICTDFLDILFARSIGDICVFLQSMKQTREATKAFLSLLLTSLGDIMRIKQGIEKPIFLSLDDAKRFSRLTTEKKLARLCDTVLDTYAQIDMNSNINLALTRFSVKIGDLKK
ncbi:MAG: DNA polymerase III subunit delta' [Clostridia bacterium]